MRILFLTRLFYPHIGGVEKHVIEISKRLVNLGHEVVVVSESSTSEESRPNSSTSGESFGHPRGVFTAYKIPIGKNEKFKKFQIWWWFWKNRKLIRQADIVHAHDVGFWYFPFRFLYPRKPFFITFHGYEQYPPSKKAILIRKISEKLVLGNICVGDYIPKWYGTKANFITY
ncbi:glycosyltransferase, partial [Candidatus Gottesmanbacteria bacterium]|nr:glycosyltransferase [Candidatus Gottesmanbacteria bacterium]